LRRVTQRPLEGSRKSDVDTGKDTERKRDMQTDIQRGINIGTERKL